MPNQRDTTLRKRIAELRKANPDYWTYARLREQFDTNNDTISSALEEHGLKDSQQSSSEASESDEDASEEPRDPPEAGQTGGEEPSFVPEADPPEGGDGLSPDTSGGSSDEDTVECDGCGEDLSLPDDVDVEPGDLVKCPNCSTRYKVRS
jgi:hypothetical protein